MKLPFRHAVQKTIAAFALLSITALAALANNNPPGGGGTTPLPKPDLTILEVQPVYYYYGTYRMRSNDELWAKIANIGQAHSGAFGMRFQWAGGYPDEMWYYLYPTGLPAGQALWVKISSHGYNLYAKGHHAQLMIDYDYYVNESNENNNVYNH